MGFGYNYHRRNIWVKVKHCKNQESARKRLTEYMANLNEDEYREAQPVMRRARAWIVASLPPNTKDMSRSRPSLKRSATRQSKAKFSGRSGFKRPVKKRAHVEELTARERFWRKPRAYPSAPDKETGRDCAAVDKASAEYKPINRSEDGHHGQVRSEIASDWDLEEF
jgi:hypothetical protein